MFFQMSGDGGLTGTKRANLVVVVWEGSCDVTLVVSCCDGDVAAILHHSPDRQSLTTALINRMCSRACLSSYPLRQTTSRATPVQLVFEEVGLHPPFCMHIWAGHGIQKGAEKIKYIKCVYSYLHAECGVYGGGKNYTSGELEHNSLIRAKPHTPTHSPDQTQACKHPFMCTLPSYTFLCQRQRRYATSRAVLCEPERWSTFIFCGVMSMWFCLVPQYPWPWQSWSGFFN